MKMILARIGWGKTYDSEELLEGGGNVRGSDRFNFQVSADGNLYGFFPVGKGLNNLNLSRIQRDAEDLRQIEGVLVVWVATAPKKRGQYIVGWYKNAVVQHAVEKRPDHGHYRVRANSKNAVLVPESYRDFQISHGVVDGQSSVRYPDLSDRALEAEFSRIVKYIDSWRSPIEERSSSATTANAEVEEEATLDREQGFQSDVVLRGYIEKWAESVVIEAFAKEHISLEPHPKPQWPWDFKYTKDGKTLFVEVKGTQGDGKIIVLTAGEVQFAEANPGEVVLCIVSDIRVHHGAAPSVSGGTLIKIHPWKPIEHELSPTYYRCKLQS